jgi:malate synthase
MSIYKLKIRGDLEQTYSDVYTKEVLEALRVLSRFNTDIKKIMDNRIERRERRRNSQIRIQFLDEKSNIEGTNISVQDARTGNFEGKPVPKDLQRQWIQGTGPAAKPNAPIKSSIRNVAYALLSGADGWMFDGEDALGQINAMSLDNQRNLKLAISRSAVFLEAAEIVSKEMNKWAQEFFGHPIINDWEKQLDFTTIIFRARGLHLDDRHIRDENGIAMSASIVDLTLYVVNNYETLLKKGVSIVLYLPKIQTSGEAAIWEKLITALENHLKLETGTIRVYVLVE